MLLCFICLHFFFTLKYQRQMPVDFFPIPKTFGTANIFLWHNCLQMYHFVFAFHSVGLGRPKILFEV
jgi:hypothetical protein